MVLLRLLSELTESARSAITNRLAKNDEPDERQEVVAPPGDASVNRQNMRVTKEISHLAAF